MATQLVYGPLPADAAVKSMVVLSEKPSASKVVSYLALKSLPAVAGVIVDGTTEVVTHYHQVGEETHTLVSAVFAAERTRNSAVIRADAIKDQVASVVPKSGDAHLVLLVETHNQALAAGAAVARAFPLYNKKTGAKKADRIVYVEIVSACGSEINYAEIERVATGIRFAGRLVDTPPSELHCDSYVDEAYATMRRLESHGVTINVIRGRDLEQQGFGGLWGVGKASEHPPALVVLSSKPANATKTLALVGKGIVYDTGGLSIKPTDGMCNMKSDMAGSAGVIAGFEAMVTNGFSENLYALLCIAENSVDERSTRNDDILYMYSGKTCEINNTDAEGRLVLGDGVAYATKHLNPDIVIDMATLTGAQFIATGRNHAGIFSNNEELEKKIVAAGKRSGDLGFPLVYSPEYLGIPKLFKSEVADMKNSVSDRMNAGSSGAGHFIEQHLCGDQWKEGGAGQYAHIDMAAPSSVGGRGTGYGVALFVELAKTIFA